MCDMQKMPTRDEASCEEDSDMNFTTFSAANAAGTHFVTTSGQMPVTKIQQNVSNNGTTLSQVVGMVGGVSMGEGMQYVRTLDNGTLQATPQIISLPITLPGSKPGDPQQTVQIQVLNPNILQQQQPKYQMQIPIQGFQQAGGVLTLAYSPDGNDAGSIQLLGNSLPEGIQVLAALPQEMQLVQAAQTQDKDNIQNNLHQVFITQNTQHVVINGSDESKTLNNNHPNITNVIIKEENDDNDDESSQDMEMTEAQQLCQNQQYLVNYLNTLPPQQAQALPASLHQFLRLNTTEPKKEEPIEIEVPNIEDDKKDITEAVLSEDGTLRIAKKKKKYRKKPSKPARPKPGQVVIAAAADGTPIYCCPECDMAYPVKEQLEVHLAVHKIERRFICGICGAGLKRKEHLERHKLGHNPERPYVCGLCRKGFKRREHLNLHTVIHSGVKTELCGFCGKGFYRKDHLRKHTRSHERRQRDEGGASGPGASAPAAGGPPAGAPAAAASATPELTVTETVSASGTIMPEITIHVPTSANMNVPIQINIPQHIVTSLSAAQQQQQQQQQQLRQEADAQSTLEALFAHHS